MTKASFYPVIGLEVHLELKTRSKMFCGCSSHHFQVKPNTQTCPVCLGLPGALPVPNQKAIDWTIMIGLALNCQINHQARFDRKHYFYPDLPKGYQISQYEQPFCQAGRLGLNNRKLIRINRVHLEEDTAKLIHRKLKRQAVTLVDFNRSGVPLVEIVTEPDISSGAQAKEFLKKLRQLIVSLNVSDCDMEKGSLRLEANVSLSSQPLARRQSLPEYKVEVKNLNSFRFVDQAINYEIKRQTRLLKQGKVPPQETRGYNPQKKQTYIQRRKEKAQDYRYFPEPDIPPFELSDQYINGLRSQLPTLPEEKINELIKNYGLNANSATLLVRHNQDQYLKQASELSEGEISNQAIANLIVNQKINPKKTSPRQLINQLRKKSQKQINDPKQLSPIVKEVINQNQAAVESFKEGKQSALSYLIGQVMAKTRGRANPRLSQKLLRQLL
jgi:aspartyl-tRNA(Asn)/glutamyl-tRNA(Gln) amidotransferase subunit B